MSNIMELIVFFIIGIVLGSFYNVVGYRLPQGESIIKPKYSYCPNCHSRLKWYELIPILSYIIQLGKLEYILSSSIKNNKIFVYF